MTTNWADAAIKNFQALKLQHDAYVVEIEPIKKAFYTFLSQNLHLSKWIEFSITFDEELVIVDDFELDLNNEVTDGVLFYTEANDYDGPTSLSFVIPFAYMTNPDEWTANILKIAAEGQKMVEDAYDSVAPGVREGLGLDVVINSVNGEDIFAVVCERGNNGITLNHPQKAKMVINSFSVTRYTGQLISSTLI
jgi:hypothetical protein